MVILYVTLHLKSQDGITEQQTISVCYNDHQVNNNGRIHPPNDDEKLADLANDRL